MFLSVMQYCQKITHPVFQPNTRRTYSFCRLVPCFYRFLGGRKSKNPQMPNRWQSRSCAHCISISTERLCFPCDGIQGNDISLGNDKWKCSVILHYIKFVFGHQRKCISYIRRYAQICLNSFLVRIKIVDLFTGKL